MSQPLISIVLPTYNGARYLEEAVDSCRQQTFTEWELIIVDDASTDGTPEIVSRLAAEDARIRCIRHSENRKLPAALNTGFSAAQGRFFTWTSDDNRYEPTALEAMHDFLRQHDQVDIVYTDSYHIDADGKVLCRKTVAPPEGLISGNVIGASFLYRRQVHLDLGGYDQTLFLVEDYDFWLRASTRFRIAPLHSSLYYYRLHDGSLTTQRKQQIARLHAVALARNLPAMTWLGSKLQAAGWLNLIGLYLQAGDKGQAWQSLGRAFSSSMLVTLLVSIKVVFMGRRITYDDQLQVIDLPMFKRND